MKVHECDGFEMAARIVFVGGQQMGGRRAAELHQGPRNRASAAAMHPENQDDLRIFGAF